MFDCQDSIWGSWMWQIRWVQTSAGWLRPKVDASFTRLVCHFWIQQPRVYYEHCRCTVILLSGCHFILITCCYLYCTLHAHLLFIIMIIITATTATASHHASTLRDGLYPPLWWTRQRSMWTSVRELAAQAAATPRPPSLRCHVAAVTTAAAVHRD